MTTNRSGAARRLDVRRLVASSGLVLVATASTPVRAAPPAPTLRASSTVAGTATEPLVYGSWQLTQDVWTLTLRSASVALGTTTVSATWRSPAFRATRNRLVFASRAEIVQQSAAGTYATEQRFRVCRSTSGRPRCSRWETVADDAVRDTIHPDTLPYRVTVGNGLSMTWLGDPTTVWFDWGYSITQRDTSVAETSVRVAVGSAAGNVG